MNEKRISEEECISIMDELLNKEVEPKAGIFWYDPRDEELFGVEKESISSLAARKRRTCDILHKDVWKKKHNNLKFRGKPLGRYAGNYTETPRGRIFWTGDNTFSIKTGHWIYDYPEAKQLIIEEFDLQHSDYVFEIGHHWEIGQGYGE